MKSPIKVALLLASGLLVLGILAWVGTFLYWHIRITAAIRHIENSLVVGSQRSDVENQDVLLAAGCRSLPYLANAMDPSNHVWILEQYQYLLRTNSRPVDGSDSDLERHQDRPHIDPIDSPELIREKCERWRTWWREWGPRYHQWWRVWSSCCRRE